MPYFVLTTARGVLSTTQREQGMKADEPNIDNTRGSSDNGEGGEAAPAQGEITLEEAFRRYRDTLGLSD